MRAATTPIPPITSRIGLPETISYVEYESNPVLSMDLVITRRGLIFKREEASISATLTPNRRFRAQRCSTHYNNSKKLIHMKKIDTYFE